MHSQLINYFNFQTILQGTFHMLSNIFLNIKEFVSNMTGKILLKIQYSRPNHITLASAISIELSPNPPAPAISIESSPNPLVFTYTKSLFLSLI